MITPEITFVIANKAIKKGEEIFIDYVQGITDQEKRNEMLKKWGIVEDESGKVEAVAKKEKVSEKDIQKAEAEFKKQDAEKKIAEKKIKNA